MTSKIIYREILTPWFKPLVIFLPPFYKYGITIQDESPNKEYYSHREEEEEQQSSHNKDSIHHDISITFGYGRTGPGGFTAQKVFLKDIDPSSVITGTATAKDNLFEFGGWGIRYSFRTNTWAYNAVNGPFVEFVQVRDSDKRRIKYRIVTQHADEVAAFLSGKGRTVEIH